MKIEGENYTLYRGDCLDIMPTLEAESVDMVITSPPYDNLRDYGKDFDADSFNWKGIISALYRIVKPGGVVVWIVADATIQGSETGTSFKQALYAMEVGLHLHDTMIYKTNKPPMNDRRYQACFEYMFVFSKGRNKTFNPILVKSRRGGDKRCAITYRKANGELRKQHRAGKTAQYTVKTSIWEYLNTGNTNSEYTKHHPATFPFALAQDHILSWSNPNDVVLDCMMGSGTTGDAAIKTKRKFIGIELDADYFEIAHQRIANAAGDFMRTEKEKETGQLSIFD